MRALSMLVVAAAVVSGACAPMMSSSARSSVGAEQVVQRVRGLPDRVSSLLVQPIRVGTLETPGFAPAQLEIGAFYARYDRPEGTIDELALMVAISGPDAAELVAQSRELLLQVDGELFAGTPGISENSFRIEGEGAATRALLAIPVSPEVLSRVAVANDVRGRLGLWGSFNFPDKSRARLAALLRELPADAPLRVRGVGQMSRVAQSD
jgi:hypothetical protein